MLTGKELGKAIAAAILMKGVSNADVARHFRVKPPSVQGWLTTGRISKKRLPELWEYFSDVVGPEHWGLPSQDRPMRFRAVATTSGALDIPVTNAIGGMGIGRPLPENDAVADYMRLTGAWVGSRFPS